MKMTRKEQLIKDLLEGTLIQNIDSYKDCTIKLIVVEGQVRVRLLENYEDNIDLILKEGTVIDVPDFYEEFTDACRRLHNYAIDEALDQGWDIETVADNILEDKAIDIKSLITDELTPVEITWHTELRLEDLADEYIKNREEKKEYVEKQNKRYFEE